MASMAQKRWAAVAMVAGFVAAGPARAHAPPRCEPARIAEGQAEVPEPWRGALDEIVEATGQRGRPWSCAGAKLRVEVDDSEATLEVEDASGRRIRRTIPTPDDLVPIGEALLAAPNVEAPPPQQAVSAPSLPSPPATNA